MNAWQESTIEKIRAKLADVGQQREAAPNFTWKEIEHLVTAIEDYKYKIAAQMTELALLKYKAQRKS